LKLAGGGKSLNKNAVPPNAGLHSYLNRNGLERFLTGLLTLAQRAFAAADILAFAAALIVLFFAGFDGSIGEGSPFYQTFVRNH
jgi:hypothetical protein